MSTSVFTFLRFNHHLTTRQRHTNRITCIRKNQLSTTMSPPAKKQKTVAFKLFYWPGMPGRGEFVRLAFEHAGVPYTEHTNPATLLNTIGSPTKSSHPPAFAPPAIELPSGRFISQTPNILNHLAPYLGLAGPKGNRLADKESPASDEEREEAEEERSVVNALVLTALDLNNEAHDTHHPLDNLKYYEEQKDTAIMRAEVFRATRLPKFFKYFQTVLASNPAAEAEGGEGKGKSTFLIGAQTTTADLTVFHIITGLEFAFPKRMAALKESGEYANVFALKGRVQGEKGIKEYLASKRRQPFSNGIFRYYEELDGEE